MRSLTFSMTFSTFNVMFSAGAVPRGGGASLVKAPHSRHGGMRQTGLS